MKNQRLVPLATFSEAQYSIDSPLLIEASALYLDRIGNACIAQIKWRNIGDKTIKAVLIKLLCFDTFGQKIDEKEYLYDRLSAEPAVEFGTKTAILLNNTKTASFQVLLKAVQYEGDLVWRAESPLLFTVLPKSTEHPFTGKLLAQYKRDLLKAGFRTDVRFQIQKNAGLWQCACGSWQRDNHPCLKCGVTETILDSLTDLPELERHLKEYEEKQRILRIKKEREEKERLKKEKIARKRRKIIFLSSAACFVICTLVICLAKFYFIPNHYYEQANILLSSGDELGAWDMYRKSGGYLDANRRMIELSTKFSKRISAGRYLTVGLKSNGTVISTGEENQWTDIIAVATDDYSEVGLKTDGTVVTTKTTYKTGNVNEWTDIVEIAASGSSVVGLKSDGTVVAAFRVYSADEGNLAEIYSWTDITAISAYGCLGLQIVGLQSDGTVLQVAESFPASRSKLDALTGSVAISAGFSHIVGLRPNGTVVAVGYGSECDVQSWSDIIAIAAGDSHTVGLKADGTVVAAGSNESGQCDVQNWSNIVAIAAGARHTVGLKADGTVVCVGDYDLDELEDINNWDLW